VTKVINLFGGSGVGKSTTAAHLFAEMKYKNLHVELVREYVKTWAWQGIEVGPFDQIYLLGKQSQYESILYGKVDYIITDSPILLCPMYEHYYSGKELVAPAAFNFIEDAKSKGVEHLNFVLKREFTYDPRGRYQTPDELSKIDIAIRDFLKKYSVPYTEISGEKGVRVDQILQHVV
jgi:nicotinamide riboside kinase